LAARIAQLKRGIARLIDAYGEGFLEKDEFEPKIRQLKARLARLEAEEQGLAQEETRRAELRLIIGQLEEFTQRMDQGLEEADWSTRREIIRALVKQIEVSDDQVRIVYRVNTVPFVKAPNGAFRKIVVGVLDTFSFPLKRDESCRPTWERDGN
jgi:site-specific DNA recombinase